MYNTSKASIKVLVGSLLGGTDLNFVAHKGCVRRASADGRKQQEFLEKASLTRQKDQEDGSGLNRLRKETENGGFLTDITHHLNSTEVSWEEFQENLLLRYGIVNLNLPTDCDVYGKKLLVPHALSCPKGGLVLARHNDYAKEWGALSARDLKPGVISYEPKINSSTVQGEVTGT